jgi:hypothetical protein
VGFKEMGGVEKSNTVLKCGARKHLLSFA